jgi:hypothetical protein
MMAQVMSSIVVDSLSELGQRRLKKLFSKTRSLLH